MLGAERIEVVRGPNGIIYGADAIGGVVERFCPPSQAFRTKGWFKVEIFSVDCPRPNALGRLESTVPSPVRTGLPSCLMPSVLSGIWKGARR